MQLGYNRQGLVGDGHRRVHSRAREYVSLSNSEPFGNCPRQGFVTWGGQDKQALAAESFRLAG